MEYLMAIDSKNSDTTTTNIKIKGYESLDKLRNGVESLIFDKRGHNR